MKMIYKYIYIGRQKYAVTMNRVNICYFNYCQFSYSLFLGFIQTLTSTKFTIYCNL